MKKSVFYSFLMAFAMIFSSALVASCGDDDPDPTPAPNPTPTPGEDEPGKDDPSAKVPGGTIYYVEAFQTSALDWVDHQTSFVKTGEAANYVSPNKDELYTFEDLPIANEDAKARIKSLDSKSVNFTAPLYKVTTQAITTYPVDFTGFHKFTLKDGATITEGNRPYWYADIVLFVCDNGTVLTGPVYNSQMMSVPAGKEKSALRTVASLADFSLSLVYLNGEPSFKIYEVD